MKWDLSSSSFRELLGTWDKKKTNRVIEDQLGNTRRSGSSIRGLLVQFGRTYNVDSLKNKVIGL